MGNFNNQEDELDRISSQPGHGALAKAPPSHPIRPIPSENERSNSHPESNQPHPRKPDATTVAKLDLDSLLISSLDMREAQLHVPFQQTVRNASQYPASWMAFTHWPRLA